MAKTKTKRAKRKATVQVGEKPNETQLANGDYERTFVTHAETATKAMAHRSGHDPVEKWKRKGYFNPVEENTIERMQDVWQAVYGEVSVTASYSEGCGGANGNVVGLRSQEREIALREALRDAEGIFQGGARAYYTVFERICRFGEHPMDVTGDRQKALLTVKFVANMIASKRIV